MFRLGKAAITAAIASNVRLSQRVETATILEMFRFIFFKIVFLFQNARPALASLRFPIPCRVLSPIRYINVLVLSSSLLRSIKHSLAVHKFIPCFSILPNCRCELELCLSIPFTYFDQNFANYRENAQTHAPWISIKQHIPAR